MKAIIQRADGGVSILAPISDNVDIAGEVAKWAALHIGEYVAHKVVEDSVVPADRSERNAWAFDGKAIKVDAVKLARLRADAADKVKI